MVQHLTARLRNEHQVLNPNADVFLRNVDARLHGETLTGADQGVIDGGHIPRFVDLQPDGVAGAVGKVGAKAFSVM